MTEDQGKDKQT